MIKDKLISAAIKAHNLKKQITDCKLEIGHQLSMCIDDNDNGSHLRKSYEKFSKLIEKYQDAKEEEIIYLPPEAQAEILQDCDGCRLAYEVIQQRKALRRQLGAQSGLITKYSRMLAEIAPPVATPQ